MNELTHHDTWQTKHEGITIEICCRESTDYFTKQPKPLWTYYIYVHEQSVPNERLCDVFLKGKWDRAGKGCPARLIYSYTKQGIFYCLDWHHGITFYEIQQDKQRGCRIAKAGCDYDHYWDEGKHNSYSVESVLCEAKHTVDCLMATMVPGLKRQCSWNGEWYAVNEGEVDEHNTFMSRVGYAAKLKAYPPKLQLAASSERKDD